MCINMRKTNVCITSCMWMFTIHVEVKQYMYVLI